MVLPKANRYQGTPFVPPSRNLWIPLLRLSITLNRVGDLLRRVRIAGFVDNTSYDVIPGLTRIAP